jgi:SAM-dependent methyltransferase
MPTASRSVSAIEIAPDVVESPSADRAALKGPVSALLGAARSYLREGFPATFSALRWTRRSVLSLRSPEAVFTKIWSQNVWRDTESVSGPGSTIERTVAIRTVLPRLLRRLEIRTMLDIPCGDFNWMKEVDLGFTSYIGADVVPQLVANNNARYADHRRSFVMMDLTRGRLPRADLIFCKDCLIHLSFRDARRVIAGIVASGARFLLATSFTGIDENVDIVSGGYRPIDLTLAPYHFPPPRETVTEAVLDEDGVRVSKIMGLWNVSDLAGRAR